MEMKSRGGSETKPLAEFPNGRTDLAGRVMFDLLVKKIAT